MKVLVNNFTRPVVAYPITIECPHCTSVLEVDKPDLVLQQNGFQATTDCCQQLVYERDFKKHEACLLAELTDFKYTGANF